MSINYFNRETVSVTFSDPLADDQRIHLWKAPYACEILDAYIVVQDDQGAGSAGTFQLENWGVAGTAVAGTIAVGLGGTAVAARLTGETPAQYTLTDGTLPDGAWVVCDYQEDTAWVETNVTIFFEVAYGLGADAP